MHLGEWFLREWTLREIITLQDVQFFNQGRQSIADKRTFAHI